MIDMRNRKIIRVSHSTNEPNENESTVVAQLS